MNLALWFVAGCAGGAAHFALLRWNTALYVSGGVAFAIVTQVLRLAAVAVLLVCAALYGALPLLLAALGIVLVRTLILQLTP